MALIRATSGSGGGGGSIQIVDCNVDSLKRTSLYTINLSDTADTVLIAFKDSTVESSNIKVMSRGDTVTLSTTGGRATTVVFTFAADGQSVSWTKDTAYGNLFYFAIKS